MEHFAFPENASFRLVNARVPVSCCSGMALRGPVSDGLATADLVVSEGRFEVSEGAPRMDIDVGGRIVLPGFVDAHVHLDKAYTVQRTGMSRNGLGDAARLAMADAANCTAGDLRRRMELAMRTARAHGTVAMRSHLDMPGLPRDTLSWQVLQEVRDRWAGRIQLQPVSLMAIQRAEEENLPERMRQLALGGGVAGAFVSTGAATGARLDRLFTVAADHGLDVDFHVDEALDPAADGLKSIAESVLRTGFDGRVVAGHCCSLAAMDRDHALRILDLVAKAGIHVVSLPLTNMCLMDRAQGVTPLRRGLTLVHEMRERGIPVSFASDNVRDPFFPHGDFDMMEVLRTAARTAHFEAGMGDWIASVFTAPANAAGFGNAGMFAAGRPADAIIFRARDWIELMSRPHGDRVVLRGGRPLAATHPDFDELNIALETR